MSFVKKFKMGSKMGSGDEPNPTKKYSIKHSLKNGKIN